MPRSRRALLASLGAAAVAGCLTGDTGTATGTNEPTPTDTSTPTDGPTPTDTPTPEPPERVESSWPAPGHDSGLSNYAPDATGPTEQVAELWRVETGPTLSAPVVADGTLYVGGADGNARAFDARTGEKQWTQSVGSAAGAPWALDGRLHVPTEEAVVTLDPADGSESWRVETTARQALLVADHGLYWLSGQSTPTAVAAGRDGSGERWRTDLDDPWEPRLFTGSGSVFVPSGTHDSRFWTLDPASGDIVGDHPRRGNDFPAEQFHRDGRVYAADAFFGTIRATGVGDGVDGWSAGVPPGGRDAGLLSGGGERAYYTSAIDDKPNVVALSTADGATEWTANVNGSPVGRVVAADGVALVPTKEGVDALDPDSGDELWRVSADAALGTDFVVVDDLLYATDGRTVRAYRPP